jgi:5-methylcytosine-specific restriction endonuclease McrA
MKTIDLELVSKSQRASFLRAAEAFPARLAEKHGGQIVLGPDAVYGGNKKHIAVSCLTCGHGWAARPISLLNLGSGCPECKRLKDINSAGKRRCPRASTAEKAKAAELYSKGWTYTAIGEELGRPKATIRHWLNPAAAEADRQHNLAWHEANREQTRANSRRYTSEFKHGRANKRARNARRRKRERGEWELLEKGQWVTIINPPTSPEDLTREQEAYLECERLTKETGVEHHVDHIMPLSIGGEHDWWNLQILTAEENLAKGNRFRPEDQELYAKRLFQLMQELSS